VLSFHVQRKKRRNSLSGKLAGSDLGGIYLRDGGWVIHVHIVSQLLNGKASALCFQAPHRVMKATLYRTYCSPECAQLEQPGKLCDMFGVIG